MLNTDCTRAISGICDTSIFIRGNEGAALGVFMNPDAIWTVISIRYKLYRRQNYYIYKTNRTPGQIMRSPRQPVRREQQLLVKVPTPFP